MKTLSFRELKVGRSAHQVLLDLDTEKDGLRLPSGLNLIVAPNGYGKTTFLQTIGGVLPAAGGKIRLEDGFLQPERDVLYVSEYLTFPKFIYPSEWLEYMSHRAWKSELEGETIPWIEAFGLEKKMGSFLGRMSQGERRKITWLGANSSPKPILLLDEPLDGLDLLGIRAARRMLEDWRKQGRILLVVAHQVGELLDLADQVLLIRDQKLLPWEKAFSGSKSAASPSRLSAQEFRQALIDFYSRG